MAFQRVDKSANSSLQASSENSYLASRPFAPLAKQVIKMSTENQIIQQEAKGIEVTRPTNLLEILFSQPHKRQSQTIQAKLRIGQPGDKYEPEADKTAYQVMQRIHLPFVSRDMSQPKNRVIQRMTDGNSETEHPKKRTREQNTSDDEHESKRQQLIYPTEVTIKGEKIRVENSEEHKQAREIIERIENDYGIKVNSTIGLESVISHYAQAPQIIKDRVETEYWDVKRLISVEQGLSHYKDILGNNRNSSSRAGIPQEVLSFSSLNYGIDKNLPDTKLDSNTWGEYFDNNSNISLYKPFQTDTHDFPDNLEKQMEATVIHEIAHGLCEYKLQDYWKALAYWLDENTKSEDEDAEYPVTGYGETNASEDLSEAVMYYFTKPDELEAFAPERYELVKKMVKEWKGTN
ncbi:hypothetical protein [Nostoc sp. C117]|uniref:hypothetical protein n=1 Tax=Nostoc sp. C117 TaxID=3349875 RepID=UPI00370DBFE3